MLHCWHFSLALIAPTTHREINGTTMDGNQLDKLHRIARKFAIGLCAICGASSLATAIQPPTDPLRFADARFDNAIPSTPKMQGQMLAEANQISNTVEYRAGRLLAVVGTEHIIEGDIMPMVEPMIRKNKIPESQVEEARQQLLRPALTEFITTKCLAQKYISDMVGSKPQKEYREASKKIDPKITEGFFSKLVPQLMEDYQVNTPSELDIKLRETGTSLASQKALFREQALARQALEPHIRRKPNFQFQDLKNYYDEHDDQWQVPAKVRYRQLTVKFSNYSNKDDARAAIAALGNEVLFGGASFESVIKRKSEGILKDEGGFHDWTDQNSLKSEIIDQALFKMPIGRLSEIIEDSDGCHILMVLERTDAYVRPFSNVQSDIREALSEEFEGKAQKEFIEKAKKHTSIWTLWPEDVPGSHPLSELFPD